MPILFSVLAGVGVYLVYEFIRELKRAINLRILLRKLSR